MSNPGIRILLVDDDRGDQLSLLRFIETEQLDYVLCCAGSVAEACRLLTTESFEVVLLDHHLPDGTAFDLLEPAGETPVIFIT